MDGTFGGGDLISASLAIMLGGTDAELHDKEVTLTTSDVTGSQTAIFEYDPQNEPVSGDPPGPWDGYSLFTIDLSAVKDDIEALQATIAAIIAILQAHDPDYDPDETPPKDGVQNVVDEEEALEDCRDAVIAKIQEYFPSFNPQTCQDLVDKIEEDEDDREDAEEHEGYTFPEGTEPTDTDWFPLIGANPITDETLDVSVFICCYDGTDYINITKQQNPDTYSFRPAIGWNYDNNTYHWGFGDIGLNTAGDYGEIVGYTVSANGSVILHLHTHIYGWDYDAQGQYTLDWHDKYYDTIPSQAQQELAGYGDPTHTYKVKNI